MADLKTSSRISLKSEYNEGTKEEKALLLKLISLNFVLLKALQASVRQVEDLVRAQAY